MNLQREATAALLRQHAPALAVQVISTGRNYTYELEVDGTRYQVCVLSTSRDFYDYRLNLKNPQPYTMLAVGEHNTRASLPILALDEGYFYAPYEAPRWYQPDVTHRRKDVMVIIGGLLCGVEEEYVRLSQMKRTTRYDYLNRMQSYLGFKQGRQLVL